ncbi:MAG TPA: hypothetical protein VHE61_19425 [Opitutaceae bacterium]|nr:hypothetical protein [Opitutaceae bacterium]
MIRTAITSALLASAAVTAAAAGHDLFVCAVVNDHYVVGSTYVTESGLFRLTPPSAVGSGTTASPGTPGWRHIGINDVGLAAVAFDPRDPSVFYTATLNGCVRTLDGGRHVRVTTSWDMTEPRDVAVDPHAPDTVYLALPDGIAVSPDRGDTWHRCETGLPERGKYTQTLAIDRETRGRVLAGCETGIYLTENGGAHWRRVLPTVDTVTDIEQSPQDGRVWCAVTQSAGGWLSHDGGATWTRMAGLPGDKAYYNLSFDATHPHRLVVGSYTYGVLTSEDGGATWTPRNAGLPPGHHVWRVGVDPDSGRLYANVTGEAIHASADFGRTWTSAGLRGSRVSRFVFVPHATPGTINRQQ